MSDSKRVTNAHNSSKWVEFDNRIERFVKRNTEVILIERRTDQKIMMREKGETRMFKVPDYTDIDISKLSFEWEEQGEYIRLTLYKNR